MHFPTIPLPPVCFLPVLPVFSSPDESGEKVPGSTEIFSIDLYPDFFSFKMLYIGFLICSWIYSSIHNYFSLSFITNITHFTYSLAMS